MRRYLKARGKDLNFITWDALNRKLINSCFRKTFLNLDVIPNKWFDFLCVSFPDVNHHIDAFCVLNAMSTNLETTTRLYVSLK